jgi:hypothetical protein
MGCACRFAQTLGELHIIPRGRIGPPPRQHPTVAARAYREFRRKVRRDASLVEHRRDALVQPAELARDVLCVKV